MRFLQLPPPAELAGQVQWIWGMEFSDPADFGGVERVLPDGIVELVFHYRRPFEMRFAGEAFAPQHRSFAVSQTQRFLEMRPLGPGGFVAVRFLPWGVRSLLAMPVSKLADRQVAAEELWGAGARRLEERIAECSTLESRMQVVTRFLVARRRSGSGDPVAAWAREIWRRRGRVGIAALARDLGVSERRLRRRFGDVVGVSPKHFSRIVRFLAACRAIRADRLSSLTEVALESGYYDQAHFANEFREFSGMTPAIFARRHRVSFLELA